MGLMSSGVNSSIFHHYFITRPPPSCRSHHIISFTCQFYDVFHSPSFVHLVMEYGGLCLYAIIDDNAGLNLTASQKVVLHLVLALEHCLDRGVVHRDLKPENVLVRTRNHVVQSVKLCDFGLCAIAPVSRAFKCLVLCNDEEDLVLHERDWIVSDFAGSPGFVAPEIVTEDKYDGRFVDLFSLGCVLLNLVLGNDMFEKIWMYPFQLEMLAEKARFSLALQYAIEQMRQVPLFSTTTSSEGSDGNEEESFQQRTFTDVGDLMFGLLEVDPKRRILIGIARHHRWLAFVPAGEDEKTEQLTQIAVRIVA